MLGQVPSPEVDLASIVEGAIDSLDWITAAAVLVGSFIVARLAKAIAMRAMRPMGGSPLTDAMGRLTVYVIVLLGLFYALSTLGVRVGPLLGALGIGGIVLALAVQGTLENFVAGFMLQARREFARGDQIVTGDHTGTVHDINARAVVLRALSGERVIVPNATVLNNPLVVLTAEPLRRSTLVVGVEYAADLARARDVLLDAVRGVDVVAANPAPDAAIAEFGDSRIDFHLRFWHGSTDLDRFIATGRVALAVKETFNRTGITIAFPQRVLWTGEPSTNGSGD